MTHKLVPIEPSEEMVRSGENIMLRPPSVYLHDQISAAYKAMLSAAPKPSIPADDREEVARAMRADYISSHKPNTKSWDEIDQHSRDMWLQHADAAIATLQRLGWKEPGKEEG